MVWGCTRVLTGPCFDLDLGPLEADDIISTPRAPPLPVTIVFCSSFVYWKFIYLFN